MLQLRPATPNDVPQLFVYLHELAEFEREPDSVLTSEDDLLRDGFGDTPQFFCIFAEWNGEPAGFVLYFHNYSSWTGRGIHIGDLYVRPTFRGKGIGTQLLLHVRDVAKKEKSGRLQWYVVAWNAPAIAFYEKMGATLQIDWRIMRVPGKNLAAFGSQNGSAL
jgi:GNAT superfamily N-acetyltransferase